MAINFANTNVEYYYFAGGSGEDWEFPDSDWFVSVKFRVPSGDWPAGNYFPVQVSSGGTGSSRFNMYGRGDGSSNSNKFTAQYRNLSASTISVPSGNTDDGVWRVHTVFRESGTVYHALGGAGETQSTNTMGSASGTSSAYDMAFGRRYADSSRLLYGDLAWVVKADWATNGYAVHDALANSAHPFSVLSDIRHFFEMRTVASASAIIGDAPVASSTADMVDTEHPLTPYGWPSNVTVEEPSVGGGFQAAWARGANVMIQGAPA